MTQRIIQSTNQRRVISMTQRTDQQRKAIEVYCRQVAEALKQEGHTLQDVVKAIRKAELTPTQQNIKAVVWNGISDALFEKKSSTEITKLEVDEIYEVMNKWLGINFHLHIPFPSEEHDDLAINARDKVKMN